MTIKQEKQEGILQVRKALIHVLSSLERTFSREACHPPRNRRELCVNQPIDARLPLALPQFAPLSETFFLHLFREEASTLRAEVASPTKEFQAKWRQFVGRFQQARESMLALTRPVVEARELTITWFRETVSMQLERKRPRTSTERALLSWQTIQRWRMNHVLLPQEPKLLDPERALAILIACAMDPREREFTPPFIDPGEPPYYCYAKASSSAPIVACPMPVPQEGPRATLYYTPFQAAYWNDPCWYPIPGGSFGCFRWGGAKMVGERIRWTWTKKDLEVWDRDLCDPNTGGLLSETGWGNFLGEEELHMFAHGVLRREAYRWLNHASLLLYVPPCISLDFLSTSDEQSPAR